MVSTRATKPSKRRTARPGQSGAYARATKSSPAWSPELADDVRALAAERGTTAEALIAQLVRAELEGKTREAHEVARAGSDDVATRVGQAWRRVASEHEQEAYELVRELIQAAPREDAAAERVMTALERLAR